MPKGRVAEGAASVPIARHFGCSAVEGRKCRAPVSDRHPLAIPGFFSGFQSGVTCRARVHLPLVPLAFLVLSALAVVAQSQGVYQPCLGCAEHHEIQVRWHRPFLTELAGEGFAIFNHYRLESSARALGLCETDILIRNPVAVGGCHAYSAKRAWLIEAPLEVALFTSPAWGLERRGHPRWAMALEFVPVTYHLLSSRATVEAIHKYQRLAFLLQ